MRETCGRRGAWVSQESSQAAARAGSTSGGCSARGCSRCCSAHHAAGCAACTCLRLSSTARCTVRTLASTPSCSSNALTTRPATSPTLPRSSRARSPSAASCLMWPLAGTPATPAEACPRGHLGAEYVTGPSVDWPPASSAPTEEPPSFLLPQAGAEERSVTRPQAGAEEASVAPDAGAWPLLCGPRGNRR